MTDSISCLHAARHFKFSHAIIVALLPSLSCAGLVGLGENAGHTALEFAFAAGQIAAAEVIWAASGPRLLGGPADPDREEGCSAVPGDWPGACGGGAAGLAMVGGAGAVGG